MKDLERVRAYVDGALPPDARAEFEARLARDGALAQLVESYGLVVRATEDVVPPRIAGCPDPRPRRSRAAFYAVAAVLLLAAGGAWLLRGRADKPTAVRLAAIPLEAIAPRDVPAWPKALATHATANEGGLVWDEDAAEAVDVARAAGRPLLVFVHHPYCPLCRQYESGPFRDRDVARAARDFVLLKVGLEDVPAWVARDLPRGWPILAVFEPAGARLAAATGYRRAPDLAQWLGHVAGELRDAHRFPFPAWEGLRDAARKLARAEDADVPALRLRLWREVEAAAGPLAVVARAARLRMAARAQDALFAARGATAARAAEILAQAAAEFEGTPYGTDLRRVLDHVREHGSFPPLREKAGG